MNIWLWATLLFVTDFVVDFAWSMYITSLATKKHLKAAFWSGFISLAGAFTVISYTENNWLIVPAVVGGMFGTYCTKYFNK